MDRAQPAIGDGVTRPAAARNPHLVDRDPQDLDIQVGVREDTDHADQVVENVDERASLRAAPRRDDPAHRAATSARPAA